MRVCGSTFVDRFPDDFFDDFLPDGPHVVMSWSPYQGGLTVSWRETARTAQDQTGSTEKIDPSGPTTMSRKPPALDVAARTYVAPTPSP